MIASWVRPSLEGFNAMRLEGVGAATGLLARSLAPLPGSVAPPSSPNGVPASRLSIQARSRPKQTFKGNLPSLDAFPAESTFVSPPHMRPYTNGEPQPENVQQ